MTDIHFQKLRERLLYRYIHTHTHVSTLDQSNCWVSVVSLGSNCWSLKAFDLHFCLKRWMHAGEFQGIKLNFLNVLKIDGI